MKTLTKILTVVTVIALCVCLFTLSAYANYDVTITEVYPAIAAADASCSSYARNQGYKGTDEAGNVYYFQSNYPLAVGDHAVFADSEQIGSVNDLYDTTQPGQKHNISHVAAVDPGCTTPGNQEYWLCSGCGKMFSDAAGTAAITTVPTVDATGHTWGTNVAASAATCQHDGNVAYHVCTVCGAIQNTDTNAFLASMSATVIPKSDHTWGAWEVTKAATNVSSGIRTRKCLNCTETQTEVIPATGIVDGSDIYPVIVNRDTWYRGEEPLIFSSDLILELNNLGAGKANYVGVRIGNDSSLYQNGYNTYDFWSWGQYVKLGESMMNGLRAGKYHLWIYDTRNPSRYTDSVTFYVVDVPTLEAYSTDKHVLNSSRSLRFISSEPIVPGSIQVGSKHLYDANDYFLSNDRTSVTLSADFLNARQAGTYTISAVTTSGAVVKANFYVLTTAQASSSPRTGDDSQIGLWSAFLLLSGAAVVVLLPKLRKHGA